MARATDTTEPVDNRKWNILPPTDSGYYWLAEMGTQPHIVRVDVGTDSHKKVTVVLPDDDMKYPVEMWPGALWSGPLKSQHRRSHGR